MDWRDNCSPQSILSDRSFITSQGGEGGRWFWRGYNFKTSPFLGGKFFTYEKREGGQILWHFNGNLLNGFYNWNQKRKNFRWRFLLFEWGTVAAQMAFGTRRVGALRKLLLPGWLLKWISCNKDDNKYKLGSCRAKLKYKHCISTALEDGVLP